MNFFVSSLLLALCSANALSAVSPLRINGLVAAVYSPFNEDSTLNISVVPTQASYLKATGVEWVFVGGTTGESVSLSVDERKQLTEAWVKTGTNVISHVGCNCLSDARALAQHAVQAGAKAIGAMSPSFFKPANAHALALTIANICAAAPTLPCYYYHIPSMTGVSNIPMFDFLTAIEPLAPNFAGIKYTGLYTAPGFMDMQECLMYKNRKFDIFSGREEMMLQALSIGVTGHVGSQFNFAGDLYNTLRERFAAEGLTAKNQEELRELQFTGGNLIRAWQTAPQGTNGGKSFMNFAGVPVGDARLPSIPLTTDARSALKEQFQGFCQDHNLFMCK